MTRHNGTHHCFNSVGRQWHILHTFNKISLLNKNAYVVTIDTRSYIFAMNVLARTFIQ